MQNLLIASAIIATLTGIVHSLLGERLIFRHLRESTLVPSRAAPPLQVRHIRILWATWHLASVLAWALAWLMWHVAQSPTGVISHRHLVGAVAAAFLGGAALVLIATRGRHPGWIALAASGILSWLAL